ncbi:MAG: molybdopterin oxidoreductase family protein, partial [Janthinobacterium lividum]
HRAEVAAVWDVDPATLPHPGLSACEMLDATAPGGAVRAMLVFACNLMVSAPDAAGLGARLDGLDLLVVADQFLSETSERADVVLPVTQWAEEEGTMTNLEGRVILRRRAMPPPPGVWTDTQILSALAARLGQGDRFPAGVPEVFEEFRRATAGGPADYAGISVARIEAEDGVFWPCPTEAHPGTRRLFLDRFATPDGLARFTPVGHRPPAEETDAAYPLHLSTGRVMGHYQTGAQTRRVPELAEAEPDAFVEIHPETARGLGIAAGDPVRLVTRRGSAVVKARMSRDIRLDTVFAPFHWGGSARTNALTNSALDPVSRIPEYKVCAVRIETIPLAKLETSH